MKEVNSACGVQIFALEQSTRRGAKIWGPLAQLVRAPAF